MSSNINTIIKRIKEIFYEKLQAKNSWGKNEIAAVYSESVSEAIAEFL